MKTVVIITPYLLGLTRGIERFCISLATAMVEKGCKVIFYTWGQRNETLCGQINPAIKIRKVPYCRYYRDKLASIFYRFWLKIDRPSTTILNFFYHGEEYLPKNGHYIYILHCPASQIPNRYEYVKPLVKAFKHIHIVAISKFVEEEASPYFEGIPMTLIYNGTDTTAFAPVEDKITSDKLRIITPAAFEERKGMHWLIEALIDFKYRDRIQYDIYGSGDETYGKRLEKLIADNHLGNIVHLKGAVNNIPELMPQYDLVALLSSGEACPLACIEGMACGLAVMVSDYPPYQELVSDDFGFTVHRENKAEIQAVLSKMIEHPEILEKMSKEARIKAEEFSWDKTIDQYINLI